MQPSRSFYFIRHGQTDWRRDGRIQGRADVPLNAAGLDEARRAAAALQGLRIDRIVASPSACAFETARVIGSRRGVTLESDERLMERAFGAHDGERLDALRRSVNAPEARASWEISGEGMEAQSDVTARSVACVCDWLTAHPGEAILFAAHGGVYRALTGELCGAADIAAGSAAPVRFSPHAEGAWLAEPLRLEAA